MMTKTDKILVIVESPAKMKTISYILRKAGYTEAKVLASVGHIMELADGGPAFNSGVYPDKNFSLNLVIRDDRKKIVSDIKQQAKDVERIYIGTDPDREGSLIGWSLIKFCELPPEKCYRAIMHEITSKAVIYALENPTDFDENIINAGVSRLIIDKLIGYGLSPIGKKYIGARSIGRYQSTGLKLISDREKEIANFIPKLYFDLYLECTKNNQKFKVEYYGYKSEIINQFKSQQDVKATMLDCKDGVYMVEDIKRIRHNESPKLPFCTATFQQEAVTKLGLRVNDAMSLVQKLFEGLRIKGEYTGLVTFVRTNSVEMSTDFVQELETYMRLTYGSDKFCSPRKTKKRLCDQSEHEALRIVNPSITPKTLAKYTNNSLLIKVYELIWQRTIASVMPTAVMDEITYIINNNGHKFKLSVQESINTGYKEAYTFEENQTLNCPIAFDVGEALENTELNYVKKFTLPPDRYTEASLIRELQRLKIGRPGTFATIIETLISPSRGYAELKDSFIIPTDLGMHLADYCCRAFLKIADLKYIKEIEEALDHISTGKLLWLDYVENFYKCLQKIVNDIEELGIVAELPDKNCPICKRIMVVRRNRFGRLFYGCSGYPDCRCTMSL